MGQTALELLTDDLIKIYHKTAESRKHKLVLSVCRENSLLAFVASGNLDPWLFQLVRSPGWGRTCVELVVRRFFTSQVETLTFLSNLAS